MSKTEKIDYFDGGIGLLHTDPKRRSRVKKENLKPLAVIIEPNEDYWIKRIGAVERWSDSAKKFAERDKEFKRLGENYWVDKDLYDLVKAKCSQIGIMEAVQKKHIGNIIIPISDYRRFKYGKKEKDEIEGSKLKRQNIKEISKLVIEEQKILKALCKEEIKLLKLTVTLGSDYVPVVETGVYNHRNASAGSITTTELLSVIENTLIEKIMSDGELNEIVFNSDLELYVKYSHEKELRRSQFSRIRLLHNYLKRHNLFADNMKRYRATGHLMNLVGYLLTEDEFDQGLPEGRGIPKDTFRTYDEYIGKRTKSVVVK